MGGELKVDWQHSSDELKHRHQNEVHLQRRTRLQYLGSCSKGNAFRLWWTWPEHPFAACGIGSGGIGKVDLAECLDG